LSSTAVSSETVNVSVMTVGPLDSGRASAVAEVGEDARKDLKAMERHLAARREAAVAGDRTAFSRAHVSFHLAVAAATHNALLSTSTRGCP
jgi:DNA-binding GntR family transcriptional regulator